MTLAIVQSTTIGKPVMFDDPITDIQPYIRSRLFTSQISLNPLISAASALLSLIGNWQDHNIPSEVNALKEFLHHEINAFESNAKNAAYSIDTITVARFILCMSIDNSILSLGLEFSQQWQDHLLLNEFHPEHPELQHTLIVIETLLTQAENNLDLIELCYICVSLSFTEKQAYIMEDKEALDDILEKLYDVIRHHRGDHLTLLHSHHITTNPRHHQHTSLRIGLIFLSTGILIACLYLTANYFLDLGSTSIYQQLHSINQGIVKNANNI